MADYGYVQAENEKILLNYWDFLYVESGSA